MRTFIILFLLVTNAVLGDMIVFKNGQVVIGRYLSEEDKKVKFQVFNEVKTINKSDITNFELGYSGIPVCYKSIDKWGKTCGDVIHLLDKNKMILGKGNGLLEKEELQLKDLESISLARTKKDDKLFYILRPGLAVAINKNGETIKGEIQSISSDSMSLKTAKDTVDVKESEVNEISWNADARFSWSFLRYLIPGLFQFQDGHRVKGIVVGLLFFGFIGGIGSELNSAKAALDKDVDYIIIDNNVYVVSNIFPNPAYQKHINNANYAIGGLTLVTLFHSYEVYSHVTKEGIKASIHMQVPTLNSPNYRPEVFQGQRSAGIEFRISFSF